MREELINLIQSSVGGCARNWAETIAGNIIRGGWKKYPYQLGQKVYVPYKRLGVAEATVKACYQTMGGTYYLLGFKDMSRDAYSIDEIYPTKEEAEKALKEGAE